jgi:hypothetical protein
VSIRQAMHAMVAQLPRDLFPEPAGRTTIPSGSGARRVLVSLATGDHRLLMAQGAPSLQAYGRRHGWDVLLSSETLDVRRPPSWFKVRLVQELLQTYEHVFWIDADAIVDDLDRNVLAEIDPSKDIWFASHPQGHDADASVLNAGVFLARSTPWTMSLLDAVWRADSYLDHNWWENAALLDLLGYSLEAPYEQRERTPWNHGIGALPLDWNSVPGYCEGPSPALNHYARGDHGDFERRLEEIARNRRAVVRRFPDDFAGEWSNSTAPIERRPTRTHDDLGLVDALARLSSAELVTLVQRLDAVNEEQRLRLAQVLDWFENAVDLQVKAELRAAQLEQALRVSVGGDNDG